MNNLSVTADAPVVYDMSNDYDFSDGLSGSDFQLATTRLPYFNREILEGIFRLDLEITKELERLRPLKWLLLHQRLLRMKLKTVFRRDYVVAYNRWATEKLAEWEEIQHSYAVNDYYRSVQNNTAPDVDEFTYEIDTDDCPHQPIDPVSPDYQRLEQWFQAHVDWIAEWACAEYSHWPEYWMAGTEKFQAIDIWADDVAEELERLGSALLSKEDEAAIQPKKLTVGKLLSPTQMLAAEAAARQALAQAEQDRLAELTLELRMKREDVRIQKKLDLIALMGYDTGHAIELSSDYEFDDYIPPPEDTSPTLESEADVND